MTLDIALIAFYSVRILGMVVIMAGTVLLVKWVNKVTSKVDVKLDQKVQREPQKDIEVEELHVSATYYRFFKHFATALIYFVGTCLALSLIPPFKSLAYSILAGGGIVSLLMTFASKEAFTNITSGLFIALFRPFQVGNHIKIGKDVEGTVKDITLYHTVIITLQQNHLMIPNSIINTQTVENITWQAAELLVPFDVYISYVADVEKALCAVQTILEAHPLVVDKRSDTDKLEAKPIVEVNVEKLLPAIVHVRAWIWAKNDAEAYRIKCDSFRKVKKAFDQEHIMFAQVPAEFLKDISKELSL